MILFFPLKRATVESLSMVTPFDQLEKTILSKTAYVPCLSFIPSDSPELAPMNVTFLIVGFDFGEALSLLALLMPVIPVFPVPSVFLLV